jgi:DNA segregation ATPase FtsK/SpoIIIE, S-DNA-T family
MSEELRKEIIGVGLSGLFIFIIVSLISYHPFDPSFNSVASGSVKNFCGRAGSYTSDFLIQVFGLMSYVITAFLAVFAFLFLRKKVPSRLPLVSGGCVLFFLSLSLLFQIPFDRVPMRGITIPLSGLLGDLIAKGLLHVFSYFGSLLLSTFLFLISLFLMFQKPLLSIAGTWLKRERTVVEEPKPVRIVQERADLPAEKERDKEKEKDRKEKKAVQELIQESLFPMGSYKLPPISLLDPVEKREVKIDKESVQYNARILEKKLKDYGIEGKVVEVRPGPVITMYEFEPAPGVKVSRIANLADDLAMALSAVSIRIIAPIPGKSVVGIEIPNKMRQTVYLREIIESDVFAGSKNMLSLSLGKTISGESFVTELTKMPHLLVAGSTGSGKSVSLNTMIISILYKATPLNVRFMMIDLKMLELSPYEGIPHLLLPVMTNAKNAKTALRWLIDEMERRYQLMSEKAVRNIDKYNQKVSKEEGGQTIPYIVVVIDELADLMMVSSKEVEEYIARLAQMARASGIHLILATQRPSVDVLTGIIKANFPARMSFKVTSKVDSRTILDTNGAESLLGAGDMLFLSPGVGRLQRVHSPFVTEGEIRRIVEFLKTQGTPTYQEEILQEKDETVDEEDMSDEKYEEAVEFVYEKGEASISMVQRRLRIGYNRAARMVERMEREGIVGPSTGIKPREVLRRKEQERE